MNARGGITAWEAWQWHQSLLQSHAAGYDPQVRMRIERGALLNEADAQLLYQQRADWRQRVEQAVAPFDGLLLPTVPLIAPTIAELDDPERYRQVNLLMLRNTSVNQHAGRLRHLPALSSARQCAGGSDAGRHPWPRCRAA